MTTIASPGCFFWTSVTHGASWWCGRTSSTSTAGASAVLPSVRASASLRRVAFRPHALKISGSRSSFDTKET